MEEKGGEGKERIGRWWVGGGGGSGGEGGYGWSLEWLIMGVGEERERKEEERNSSRYLDCPAQCNDGLHGDQCWDSWCSGGW